MNILSQSLESLFCAMVDIGKSGGDSTIGSIGQFFNNDFIAIKFCNNMSGTKFEK
jgi:hypothetical protein